jgi:hypothetical protein
MVTPNAWWPVPPLHLQLRYLWQLCWGMSCLTSPILSSAWDRFPTKTARSSSQKQQSQSILRNVTKGVRWLHTTFGSFRLFSLPTEQLISQVNMLMQHYHALTNLGQKIGCVSQIPIASIGYSSQPTNTRLCQVGTARTAILGKNAMTIVTPLQHTPSYGVLNNFTPTGEGSGINGFFFCRSS